MIAAAAAKSLQSCLTLCDSTDSSPPGFPVPGILQARTLEWVAISLGAQILTWKLPVGAVLTVFGKDTHKVIYVKVVHETI